MQSVRGIGRPIDVFSFLCFASHAYYVALEQSSLTLISSIGIFYLWIAPISFDDDS